MAALHAARSGSVLLADSSKLPRDKSCGGMLHELTQQFLEPYGEIPGDIVLDPGRVDFRYVDWDRRIRKPTALRFINVDRAGFDAWLASLLPSSVEVCARCAVDAFSQDDDGVDVTLRSNGDVSSIRCGNLIGADGPRSAVRRALGLGTASTYVTLQDFLTLHAPLEPYFDCIYMREVGDELAYAYLVPKGDTAIVGSVFYPGTRRPREKHEQVLRMLKTAYPQLGSGVKREAATALHLRSMADVVPGLGRVLLAGEAGGFMSPTSGEGISYALRTGRAAGEAISRKDPQDALARFRLSTVDVAMDIRRRLRWLPVMESSAGKYLAGFVPTPVVSKVTMGL